MIETSASISVLVVEDEILIAADVEELLRERGHSVLGPCAAVNEALALLHVARPDFAILDFCIAGGSSLPLARELRRLGIPFAFLTGSSGNELAAREFDDCAIVSKPFEPNELFRVVESSAPHMRRA
jgi:DNA-binding response OmpR family regulator